MARFVLNSNGFVVGSVTEITDGPAKGFRFIPMVQRSPSRRSWPTPEAALPRDFRRTGCKIIVAESISEATSLGGIWRREGLSAMLLHIASRDASLRLRTLADGVSP